MDLNTVEVLGLWNLPHIGVGGSLCPPGSARKGGPQCGNSRYRPNSFIKKIGELARMLFNKQLSVTGLWFVTVSSGSGNIKEKFP